MIPVYALGSEGAKAALNHRALFVDWLAGRLDALLQILSLRVLKNG